jgi:DNA repair photolyase
MATALSLPPDGRGTTANPAGRFDRLACEPDAAALADPDAAPVPTEYLRDTSRTVISRNDSDDVPYDFSLNPYRGCEHGCIYCYARPYHEYLGYSAGLDFETKILVKEDAASCLSAELRARRWTGQPIALSGVTDAYQPVERRLGITRACLEVMEACRQPVSIISKSGLVLRDADLLASLARFDAAAVMITMTTLDDPLRRALEPRAASVDVRLATIEGLAKQGVPVGVMIAPVIPGLTEHEIPEIVRRAAEAGATFASYTVLRLPYGVGTLFDGWLVSAIPGQRSRVIARLRDVRGGRLNDTRARSRMRGEGPLAELAGRLFHAARERHGLSASCPALSSASFRRPSATRGLFDN